MKEVVPEFSWGYFWAAGGFAMYQVALFGLIVLATALWFAVKRDERQLPFLRSMTFATLLSVVFAVVSDVATVCYSVPKLFANKGDWPGLLLLGLFESLTPAALGLGLLSLAWFITAIGVRRLATGA
jgi:magnesium-transporting ATPase (P-type)